MDKKSIYLLNLIDFYTKLLSSATIGQSFISAVSGISIEFRNAHLSGDSEEMKAIVELLFMDSEIPVTRL